METMDDWGESMMQQSKSIKEFKTIPKQVKTSTDDDDWGESILQQAKSSKVSNKELPKFIYSQQIDPRVKKLWDTDTAVQKSPEWFSIRKNCITASDIGSVLPLNKDALSEYAKYFGLDLNDLVKDKGFCNPYSNLSEVVLRKCNLSGGFSGNVATEWGSKYELIAQRYYEKLKKTDLLEFGLIIDAEHPWLAASPDGITAAGVMLEIKCPLNRPITNIVPLSYWIQQQIQMQACKFDTCDFLDCSFLEFISRKTWVLEISKADPKDGPLRYGAIFTNFLSGTYIYPPAEIDTKEEMLQWESEMHIKCASQVPSYYVLDDYILTPVKRSTKWFSKNMSTIRAAWDIILDIRTHKTDPQLEGSRKILEAFKVASDKPKRKRLVKSPQKEKKENIVYF